MEIGFYGLVIETAYPTGDTKMATASRHKELTSHIRGCVARLGIKARVMMDTGNGGNRVIKVVTPTYEARFTAAEIEAFCLAAKMNRLTFVKGVAIDPIAESALTDKNGWHFYLPHCA